MCSLSDCKKLRLLIWKNFVLQKRHKWQTLFEVASPVLFALLVILVRCLVNPVSKLEMNYRPFSPTFFNSSALKLDFANLSKFSREKTVAFSPDSPLTRNVTKAAMTAIADDNLGGLSSLLFELTGAPEPEGYKSAKALEEALVLPKAMDRILVGVQFDDKMTNATEWPDSIRVALRFPAVMRTPMLEHPLRASWRTNLRFPLFLRPGPRNPDDNYGGPNPGYVGEMFIAVQHAVSREIIQAKSGKPFRTRVQMQRFSQAAYTEDMLLVPMERLLSMIVMLCFAYTFVNTVRTVTAEKELQLKETMTVMGLSNWLHWTAWFVKQMTLLLASVSLLVLLFKIPLKTAASGERFSILTHTPPSVLFFFLLLFVVASLAFCFMVSVFFDKASTAASFMGLAWFTTFSVYLLTQVLYEDIGAPAKAALGLVSNAAMGYAFQMIIQCEGTGVGLQWADMFKPISYQDTFLPGHVACLLLLDAALYMLLAAYVERVRPGRHGVPLPWHYPVSRSYWMPARVEVKDTFNNKDMNHHDPLLATVHDEEPRGARVGVDVKNLTKVYSTGKKAVDNLSMRLYEDEITVLLGHNGAGKTTTISMLTGSLPPSSGTAILNSHDIVQQTERARRSLGVCPQHNVLFPDLTVAEHIVFYGQLKGVARGDIEEEVDRYLKVLNLEDKRDVTSAKLSGGQQRRLSVGVAMCGASRVVLLDEPSSGLDPAARRALWDLLQREKKGRTMILTTHFMDEADVLGDRVAIMAGGRLRCIGTPYFLKRHYGVGYKLTIVKAAECRVAEVTAFLKEFVADAAENSNVGAELTYILRQEEVSKFPEMLKQLEEQKERLQVSSYGLSVTSLEEVFMKVGAEEEGQSSSAAADARGAKVADAPCHNGDVQMAELNGRLESALSDTENMEKVKGLKLHFNQVKAMFLKLFYHYSRSKIITFIQVISPVINISISVLVSRSWKFISQLPPFPETLENGFPKTNTLMSHTPDISKFQQQVMNQYKDYFKRAGSNMQLTDIGTNNITNYYLKLAKAYPTQFRFENLIGASFGDDTATAWFSNYGYHDPAVALATLNNAVLRAAAPAASLTVVNQPLPYSIEHLVKVMASGSSMGFQFAFNIGFCMAFVTSFLVLFVIKERISGAKQLQLVGGVRPSTLWGCVYVWDCGALLLAHLAAAATLLVYSEPALSAPADIARILLVLVVFSAATIPLHYLLSFRFSTPATGFSKMCFINVFSGCMPFIIVEVLRAPEVGSLKYARIFDLIFSPLPLYCLSRCFRDMTVTAYSIAACDALCGQFLSVDNCTRQLLCSSLNISVCCIKDDPYMSWSEPGIGRYLFTMLAVGAGLFTVLLLKENGVLNKLWRRAPRALPPLPTDEDSDVSAERAAVRDMTPPQRAARSLVCEDLTKYYGDLLSVNRLTFAVEAGSCFGLLGVNGAGKTTTFRMLTAAAAPSAGRLLPRPTLTSNIGYCPQFDALLDNLTAREHLRIISLLRGVPARVGGARGAALARALGFEQHYDKRVNKCSGGTKRKISTAIALLGDAPLIYLDEPTTGMDPASKRLVWRCVSAAAARGRCVVLTSHSMEECEALCSRLTVMVRGRLHCLGPLQHLKNKFSQGYTVIVKCKAGPDHEADVAAVSDYITQRFADAKLIETYLGISTYYIGDAGVPWWKVFAAMERAAAVLPVEDYSVSQTTLEQVFMRLTRAHGNKD